MLWPDPIILEIAGKLNQLGLNACPVCGSDSSLHADKRPTLLPIRSIPWLKADGSKDPHGNVLFMVRVECEMCGHSLLFNSAKFFASDTPTLLAE